MPPSVSRIVLDAQEDLRREIARAMHDGPAQSLTNIVLQAQIVERLVAARPGVRGRRGPPPDRDGPADPGRDEVVHLRRPADGPRRPGARADPAPRDARARAKRAGVPVEFESLGEDRRLPMDLESGLFRMLDEALAAYLAGRPDPSPCASTGVSGLEAGHGARAAVEAGRRRRRTRRRDKDLPPALAAMMEDAGADGNGMPPRPAAARRSCLPPALAGDPGARRVDRGHRRAAGEGGVRLRPAGRSRRPATIACGVRPRAAIAAGSGPRRVRADPRPDQRADRRLAGVFGGAVADALAAIAWPSTGDGG